jgi:ABC-2 type transport system permease protein
MSGLTGTIRLTRLAVRRDRVTLSAWILGLTGFLAATTAMFVNSLATYDDAVQETSLSTTNPGLRMLGLTSGPSVGGATMVRDYVSLAVLAALMSTLAVVRHTRQDEKLGRTEMVGATVVGRYAGLAAAVVVTVAANVVLAVLLGLAMMVNGQPASGSLTAGAAVAAVGVGFVGVAATTSQLASTARGAIGLAGAPVGLAFLLSGIGNMLGTADSRALRVTSAWPAWLSPIGWGQQMRPFGGDHWWPLGLFAALFVCLLTVAFLLVGRRDVGRGMWPERRGDAVASAALLSPTGLVWRLQRGALLGWAVGMVGFGLIFGAMSEQIQDVHGTALEWYTKVGGTDRIVDAYRASLIEMAGMAVAIYVVQMLLRMRVDESGGTLESLLATGVSRPRWVLGHVLNAAAGAVVLLLLFAASLALTAGLVLGDTPSQMREMTQAALVQLPEILVVGAAVVAAVGLLPRGAAPLTWGLLLASLMLGPMFGPALGLPLWVQNLSPFTHIPKAPATAVTAAPLLVLTAACIALAVAGVVAIRRRDLVLPA